MSRSINITEGTVTDLKGIYPSFEQEFPVDERKELAYLEGLMARKQYKLILAKEPIHNETIGYALIYVTKNRSQWWLDYIAIIDKYQGQGYGSIFLNKISDVQSEAKVEVEGARGMFMEVEIPDVSDPTYKEQVRRIGFYERLGAKRLDMDYILPTIDGGRPMYLYYKPIASSIHLLSKETIGETIIEVFEYVHKDINNRKTMLDTFIGGIEDMLLR